MSKHDQAMKDINVIAEKLTITQSLELSKMISTVRNYINDMEALETEHEALKRDIARYFEIDEKSHVDRLTVLEGQEKVELAIKLSKVGKEE